MRAGDLVVAVGVVLLGHRGQTRLGDRLDELAGGRPDLTPTVERLTAERDQALLVAAQATTRAAWLERRLAPRHHHHVGAHRPRPAGRAVPTYTEAT